MQKGKKFKQLPCALSTTTWWTIGIFHQKIKCPDSDENLHSHCRLKGGLLFFVNKLTWHWLKLLKTCKYATVASQKNCWHESAEYRLKLRFWLKLSNNRQMLYAHDVKRLFMSTDNWIVNSYFVKGIVFPINECSNNAVRFFATPATRAHHTERPYVGLCIIRSVFQRLARNHFWSHPATRVTHTHAW